MGVFVIRVIFDYAFFSNTGFLQSIEHYYQCHWISGDVVIV